MRFSRKKYILAALVVLFIDLNIHPVPKSHAWDPRNPEVVYAEGIVEGTRDTTLRYFKERETWLTQKQDEYRNTEFAKLLPKYRANLQEFSLYMETLIKDPEVGKTMTPNHPKIRTMYDLIAKTDAPLSLMLQIIIAQQSPS